MKRQNIYTFIVLFAISLSLFSCRNNGNNGIGRLEFDSIQVNRTAHLFNDTTKPACNILINFTYIVNSSENLLKDSLNKYFLSACFNNNKYVERPDSIIKAYADNYICQYRHDLEPMYLEDEKSNETKETVANWYSYYKGIEGHVQYCTDKILTYRIDYQEYTGGAHGMYTSTFMNFDLTLMRPLHLSDLFIGDYQEILSNLIWNQLMKENNVASREELENLGYGSTGEIAPIENFYLNNDGITFYYNVYDIAPYVMGAIKVTIPFHLIEEILNYKIH